MLVQDSVIDGSESVGTRKTNCEDVEVSLKSRIYCKAARSRVHARNILTVMYILERQPVPVVPNDIKLPVIYYLVILRQCYQ